MYCLFLEGLTADDPTFARKISAHDTLNCGRLGYSKYAPQISGLGYPFFLRNLRVDMNNLAWT